MFPYAIKKAVPFKLTATLFMVLTIGFVCCHIIEDEEDVRQLASQAKEKGDWSQAAILYQRLFLMDTTDAGTNYQAGLNFLKSNRPTIALDILNSFDPQYLEKETALSLREARIAKGYYMTGDYEKVLEVARAYTHPKMYRGLAREHVKALVRLDSFELLSRQLKIYQQTGIYRDEKRTTDVDFLYRAICNELILTGNEEQLAKYALEFSNWINAQPDGSVDYRNLAYAAFYSVTYDKAVDYCEQAIASEDDPRHLIRLAMLQGVCYARQGISDSAQQQIDKIFSFDDPAPRHDAFGAKYYNQARIEANLGEKDQAVESLIKALNAHSEFWSNKFKEDGFLVPLFGHAPFEELLTP